MKKRLLSVIVAVCLLAVMGTAFTTTASASWYQSYYKIANTSSWRDATYKSQTRYFDGNNIGFEVTSSNTGCYGNGDGYYRIELWRASKIPVKVRTGYVKASGFSKCDFWSINKPGDYYFLICPEEYKNVEGTNFKMFSW